MAWNWLHGMWGRTQAPHAVHGRTVQPSPLSCKQIYSQSREPEWDLGQLLTQSYFMLYHISAGKAPSSLVWQRESHCCAGESQSCHRSWWFSLVFGFPWLVTGKCLTMCCACSSALLFAALALCGAAKPTPSINQEGTIAGQSGIDKNSHLCYLQV